MLTVINSLFMHRNMKVGFAAYYLCSTETFGANPTNAYYWESISPYHSNEKLNRNIKLISNLSFQMLYFNALTISIQGLNRQKVIQAVIYVQSSALNAVYVRN